MITAIGKVKYWDSNGVLNKKGSQLSGKLILIAGAVRILCCRLGAALASLASEDVFISYVEIGYQLHQGQAVLDVKLEKE